MITISEYIPINKLGHFHTLLCRFGGKYLSNPSIDGPYATATRARVVYIIGDGYKEFIEAWVRGNTRVVERRRNQWWRVALRNIGITWW